MAGDDCGFDVAAAVQHVAQNLLEARQRRLSGDVVGGANLFCRDQSEGPANRFWSVVERRFQGDFGVVQAIGLELHLGSAGASAEEIDGAAFADHVDGPLPGFGAADGFDHHVASALLRRERADGVHYVRNFSGLNNLVRAHVLGGFDLAVALDHGDHVASDGAGDLNEHEADGASTEDGDGVADLDSSFVQSAQNAGQRLGHGGVFDADVGRNDQHVGFNDAAWNADVFGVGAVVEEEIFAEIFLMLGAVEAHLARGGVERDNAHALLEAINSGSDFLDDSGEFVAEQGGRDDHAGMIAALVDLEIGTAGQGDLDLDENLAVSDARDGNFFDFEIFFAVQDGGGHFSIHCVLPSGTSGAKAPSYICTLTVRLKPRPSKTLRWHDKSRALPQKQTLRW